MGGGLWFVPFLRSVSVVEGRRAVWSGEERGLDPELRIWSSLLPIRIEFLVLMVLLL